MNILHETGHDENSNKVQQHLQYLFSEGQSRQLQIVNVAFRLSVLLSTGNSNKEITSKENYLHISSSAVYLRSIRTALKNAIG